MFQISCKGSKVPFWKNWKIALFLFLLPFLNPKILGVLKTSSSSSNDSSELHMIHDHLMQILSYCVSILYWRLPTWARLECRGLLLRICQTVSDRCATEKLVMIWASVNGEKLERGFSFIFLKNFNFRVNLGSGISIQSRLKSIIRVSF